MKCPHCAQDYGGPLMCGYYRSYVAGCRCEPCRSAMSVYQRDKYRNGYRRPSRRKGSRFGDPVETPTAEPTPALNGLNVSVAIIDETHQLPTGIPCTSK